MMFTKSFTQQEALPQAAIDAAVAVMESGRLHRYNVVDGEESHASLFESEFAQWLGVDHALACSSCGYALSIALKVAGVGVGDAVLTNAFTLAPVPGAIDHAGGRAVLVECDENLCIDIEHLRAQLATSKARYLLLSHMRGHIADMDAIVALCRANNVILIEDCAHTMGATWDGKKSGTFGHFACFSTQTYKHLNSGEGGILTTNDAHAFARAIILSGSYMLYSRNGTAPVESAFDAVRLTTPNYSGRMDNLRAAILRPQLAELENNCARWNVRHDVLAHTLDRCKTITLPAREAKEGYVASSLQFRVPEFDAQACQNLVVACARNGVELKWFGRDEPLGFTSRYDSWCYLEDIPQLPQTRRVLATTFDVRIPLTFAEEDMRVIGGIIIDAVQEIEASR